MGFGCKALARDAAVLDAFGPVFAHAKKLWPNMFPDEFYVFVGAGQGLAKSVHERAHVSGPMPPASVVRDWRAAAVEACEGIALSDPEWFRQYWGSVMKRGLKLPTGINLMLVAISESRRRAGLQSS